MCWTFQPSTLAMVGCTHSTLLLKTIDQLVMAFQVAPVLIDNERASPLEVMHFTPWFVIVLQTQMEHESVTILYRLPDGSFK